MVDIVSILNSDDDRTLCIEKENQMNGSTNITDVLRHIPKAFGSMAGCPPRGYDSRRDLYEYFDQMVPAQIFLGVVSYLPPLVSRAVQEKPNPLLDGISFNANRICVAKIVADVLLKKTLTETPETPDIKKDYINIILASSIRFVSLFIHYMIINPDKNNVEDELLKELTLMFGITFFYFMLNLAHIKRIESRMEQRANDQDLNQAVIDPDQVEIDV